MKKLNLGCGIDYKEGFINIDQHSHINVDVVHNLNEFPYPFADNSLDHINAYHILEHLDKPFWVMKELHRILKPEGILHVKVPHFSRGFTHAEHKAGFDVTFPYYFNPEFTKSGYFGVHFQLDEMRLNYMAFFHLLDNMGYSKLVISLLRRLNGFLNFFANISPAFCSRVWCFWVGGFDEIEFRFVAKK